MMGSRAGFQVCERPCRGMRWIVRSAVVARAMRGARVVSLRRAERWAAERRVCVKRGLGRVWRGEGRWRRTSEGVEGVGERVAV